MSFDFPMTPMCSGCGAADDLYGSDSLCLGCGIMGLDISKDDTAAMDTSSPSPVTVPITEDELRAVLLSRTNLTSADLGSMFKPRLRSREDREVFTAFLRKNCKLNMSNGNKYVVLREDTRYTSKCNVAAKETSSPSPRPLTAPSSGPITEDEIRALFMTTDNVTTMHIVSVFKSRLRSREEKDAFAAKLRKSCRLNKINGISYVYLKDTKRRR